MDKTYSHLTVCLDRSGSMQDIRSATIAGFNEFLSEHRTAAGKTTLTLIGFDDHYDVWRRMDSADYVLTEETFVPRGWTALYDAMGRSIMETGEDLRNMSESDRPSTVLFTVITDGLENRSRLYSSDRIKALVESQKQKYQWEFFFIGANQDAVLTAGQLGIPRNTAITYSPAPQQVRSVFKSAARSQMMARAGKRPSFSPSARSAAIGPPKRNR